MRGILNVPNAKMVASALILLGSLICPCTAAPIQEASETDVSVIVGLQGSAQQDALKSCCLLAASSIRYSITSGSYARHCAICFQIQKSAKSHQTSFLKSASPKISNS
jgi:hypothetical protein